MKINDKEQKYILESDLKKKFLEEIHLLYSKQRVGEISILTYLESLKTLLKKQKKRKRKLIDQMIEELNFNDEKEDESYKFKFYENKYLRS